MGTDMHIKYQNLGFVEMPRFCVKKNYKTLQINYSTKPRLRQTIGFKIKTQVL